MKKFSAIIIILSLLVSVFDIIDTSDIKLGNEKLFSSINDIDQDYTDDLDLEGVLVSGHSLPVFNLVEIKIDLAKGEKSKVREPIINQKIPEDYISKIKKPPIV